MSRGDLQEMEVGTKQSKTAVNANAKAGDGMPKLASGAVAGQSGSWEDLGGPTPENYRSDDDSAKLKTPGATLKQVRDVVNKGAKAADPMKGMKEESEFDDEDEELLEAKSKKEEEDEDEEEEDEEEMEESFQIEDDVNALLTGEELSEDFKEKAKTIFEAAIRSKVSEIREEVEAQYEQRLLEEVEEIKEALADRVDAYLEYVSEEWFTENELAIEQGLKTEMTESFLEGMRGLFEDHYVSIPEDKYDVLESMVEKLDDMETKLNEQIEKNVSLNKRLAESVADGILDQVSEGLAITQKEKLASLAESVEFESEEEYREKLEMLRESYFPAGKTPKAQSETLSEGVDHSPETVSGTMAAYLKTLQAVAKN
jgi:AcrR family transcriptional regulator